MDDELNILPISSHIRSITPNPVKEVWLLYWLQQFFIFCFLECYYIFFCGCNIIIKILWNAKSITIRFFSVFSSQQAILSLWHTNSIANASSIPVLSKCLSYLISFSAIKGFWRAFRSGKKLEEFERTTPWGFSCWSFGQKVLYTRSGREHLGFISLKVDN
jgi:hypothetical protein